MVAPKPRRPRAGLLAELMAYSPLDDAATKSQKLSSCPRDVSDQVSVIRRLTDGAHGRGRVAEFLIAAGVDRLSRIEDVATIDAAREVLEAHGDTRRTEQLRWTFTVASTTKPHAQWYRLDEATWATCGQLATAIGLPHATTAVLALMAAMIEFPIANHVRAHMVDQLVAFRDRLREQAEHATEHAKRSTPAAADRRYSFERDILRKGR